MRMGYRLHAGVRHAINRCTELKHLCRYKRLTLNDNV